MAMSFEDAQAAVTLLADPGNDVKLKLYALYKQATDGDVQGKRPGMTNFVGRAKWDAWEKLQGMSSQDAEQAYIEQVESMM